jgi:chorismate mutase
MEPGRRISMALNRQDPREMSDEETMQWMQELIEKVSRDQGSSGNACSFEAVKHHVRRNILRALKERALTIDEVARIAGMTGAKLNYHLNVLKTSYFIDIKDDIVDLTPGGVAVVRADNQAANR